MGDTKATGITPVSFSWAVVTLVFLAWLKDVYSWGSENCFFCEEPLCFRG